MLVYIHMCEPLEGSEQRNDFAVYIVKDHQLLQGIWRMKTEIPIQKLL